MYENPLAEEHEGNTPAVLHIALFIPTYGDGGVERNFINLANGFTGLGHSVSLLMDAAEEAFLDHLAPAVQRVPCRGRTVDELEQELEQFLIKTRPHVVMTGQARDDAIAVKARQRLGDPNVRFFLNVGTPLSVRDQDRISKRFWLSRWFRRRKLKRLFSRCDGIIANSEGVARDLEAYLQIPRERVSVVGNPAVPPGLDRLAAAPVDHPWLSGDGVPVIVGAGRLSRVKDFATLLRAFALLRRQRPCRLMILGRGRQLPKLKALAKELGVADEVDFTGFVENPYAYLARARLLVVSSLREGGPNVLIEALAVGTPVVATDCPSGPREILEDGRYGRLVPLQDPPAMAAAMAETLDQPPPADCLRQGASRYTIENSARGYLRAFGWG